MNATTSPTGATDRLEPALVPPARGGQVPALNGGASLSSMVIANCGSIFPFISRGDNLGDFKAKVLASTVL